MVIDFYNLMGLGLVLFVIFGSPLIVDWIISRDSYE
jgi:hypothetical protein